VIIRDPAIPDPLREEVLQYLSDLRPEELRDLIRELRMKWRLDGSQAEEC
jgi:hypothetical protein